MIYKKVIGTLALLVVLLGGSLATYSYASAHSNPQSNLNYEGVVTAISSNSITLLTCGRHPVQIYVDHKTNYTGKLKFEDIAIGDTLKINAKMENGKITAKTVKLVKSGSGYGHHGDPFHIIDCWVTDKDTEHHNLTVDDGGKKVVIHVDSSTDFMKWNFDDVKVGDRSHVTGEKSGDEYFAHNVMKEDAE